MNILERIKEWFEGPREQDAEIPPYNVGQETYQSQTAEMDVQHQVTPREIHPIPVDISGIVPTWNMPSKHQVIRRTSQGSTQVQDFLDGDYKYKRVSMWISFAVNTQSTGVFIGEAKDLIQSASGGSQWGCELPLYFPIVLEGVTKKISFIQTAASITANGPLSINYVAERWAD